MHYQAGHQNSAVGEGVEVGGGGGMTCPPRPVTITHSFASSDRVRGVQGGGGRGG